MPENDVPANATTAADVPDDVPATDATTDVPNDEHTAIDVADDEAAFTVSGKQQRTKVKVIESSIRSKSFGFQQSEANAQRKQSKEQLQTWNI